MNWAFLFPIVMIAGVGMIVIATTWIRAKHGYPLENSDGSVSGKLGEANTRLEAENRELKQQVGQLLERVAVLERIATDPAERAAREIEALRE